MSATWRSRDVTWAPSQARIGGLIARAGPDLEDPVARVDGEVLGHPGDHERLADGLAGVDRECLVGVGGPTAPVGDERLAGDGAHRREDALVGDAAGAQLMGDHGGPGALWVRGGTGHAVEDTPHVRPPISPGSGRGWRRRG